MDLSFDQINWKLTGTELSPRATPLPVASKDDVRLGTSHLDGEGNARIPAVEHVEEGYEYDTNDSLTGTFAGGGGTALATPAIAWTDGADGASGTIAVSAATDGTTNAFYYRLQHATEWVAGGSRTGNGNISVTTPGVGWYYGRLTSTLGAASTVSQWIVFQVTNATEREVQYRVIAVARVPGTGKKRLTLEKIDRPLGFGE